MKSLKIIVAAALAASMLVGCGSTSDDKAIYNFSSEADVTSLDSSVSDDGVSFNAIHAFSEGLMDITAKGGTKLVPAAASSYKVSDDGLTYTFTIRKNAKWSNGDDLTADDFVYSWRKLIANAGSYAYIFGKEGACIKNADELAELGTTAGDKIKELGVEAKDKKTLQVTLSQPCPYFLEIMTFPCFYPQNQKFVEKCGSKYATDAKYLLANGPFKVTKWTKSNKITFEKNNKYYDADKIELDGLNMYLVQDPKTAAAAFDNGKVDFATINSALVDKYEGKDSLVKFKQGYMYYLYLNFNNKALANTNIRKALSLAIDRKDLCNKVLKDGSREADGFVSADFTYGPDGKEYRSEGKDYTQYNLKEAQVAFDQGLKELGVSSLKLRLLYGTDETPADTEAEYLQACFKKLKGLDIEMVATVKKDRVERQKSDNFDISCARWGPDFPDPITYLNLVSTGNSNNYGKYNNAKYDQLIATSTTERDAKKRWQMLYQAEDICMSEYAVLPVFQKGAASLQNKKYTGIVYEAALGSAFTFKFIHKTK
ncbi:peptide ABC transporter substrate-binding protein [Catenibacterium faecis]|nr:peptide ABC transporter substrate-binding protein [Catenibacterium faecis]